MSSELTLPPTCKISPGSDEGASQERALEWLSPTSGCPPANSLAPLSSSFLDNFLDELEKLSALTLPANQAKPDVLEETILEIKEEPSALLPSPPAPVPAGPSHSLLPFSQPIVTSAAAHPPSAKPLQTPIEATQNKLTDLKKMRRGFSDPKRFLEVLGDKFVASACTNVSLLPITLPVIGEEDEESGEKVVAGFQKWQPESQEQEALWCGHGGAEVTPELHIEEEKEEENPVRFSYPRNPPTDPSISKADSSAAENSNEVF